MPQFIFDLLLPIFEDLSNNALLSRCLHGKTQNANEELNSIVWSKCPKNIFVSKELMKIGLNSAILQFNEGARGIQSGVKTISSPDHRDKDAFLYSQTTLTLKLRRHSLVT